MAKHKGKDIPVAENDVAVDSVSATNSNAGQTRHGPSRASKSNAEKAWDPLKPRSRKSSQRVLSDPEDDEGPEEHTVKKRRPPKSAASVEKQYQAPDIRLDTDDDAEDEQPVKKKRNAVSSRTRKDQDDTDEHAPAPAKTHTRSTHQKSAEKAQELIQEESSGSGGDEDYRPDNEDEGEESSEDSGLEALEKDTAALERQFRDEDPTWADDNGPVEDFRDSDGGRRYPAPKSDTSANQHDDDDTQGKLSRLRIGSSPQPQSMTTFKKKRVKPSSPGSDESDAPPAPLPPKKKKKPDGETSNPMPPTSDGKHDRHKARGAAKLAGREVARVGKENGKSKVTSVTAPRADKATPAKPSMHKKRKRAVIDENVSWADGSDHDDDNEVADNAISLKRPRARVESDDSALSNSDSDSDSNDSGAEVVLPVKGHLKLTDQHRRVKRVVSTAIQEVLIIVCTKDAFPEGTGDAASYARRALINAAKSFDDKEMIRRLKSEEKEYWQKLASIVTQRMSNLRGKVKKATDSTPSTLFNLKKGDATHVMYLQEGLRYAYPHDRAKDTVDGTQPFVAPIFGEVIGAVFFRCPRSLGYRLVPYFTSSLPDKPDEKEIPAPLLALASTGLYASIDDYRHLPYRCKDFTVNANLEAYKQNIDELSDLKYQRPVAYHKLMHGLYLEICGGGSSGVPKPPRRSFLNTTDMVD